MKIEVYRNSILNDSMRGSGVLRPVLPHKGRVQQLCRDQML